jgi:hypothetical protein
LRGFCCKVDPISSGSHQLVVYLKKKVDCFLKSNLHLKVSTHEIIRRDQSSILFLGHKIQLVYFYQKAHIKNKRLEAIHRYKNKIIRRLKLEEYKISRFQMNTLKKKMLKHIEIISKELYGSAANKKKKDLLASLFAYKFFGDVLAKTVNFRNLRELVQFLFLWNTSGSLHNLALKNFYALISKGTPQSQSVQSLYKNAQTHNFRYFDVVKTKKTWNMLKEIQVILKNKAKPFTGLTIPECVEIKSKQIMQMHIQKSLHKQLSRMVSPMLKKEEIYKSLAGNFVDWSLQNQPIRYYSVQADMVKLCDKLREVGFMHPLKSQASSCSKLMLFSENDIIKYYNSIMKGILSWFGGVDNFQKTKKFVESVVRRSCWLTLKRKFKLKSIAEVIDVSIKDVIVGTREKCTRRKYIRKMT